MATPKPAFGSTLQGDQARQSAFGLWMFVRTCTVYPLAYLAADGIGGVVARFAPVDAYDVRILILATIIFWHNSARFFHYRFRWRAQTVTPLTHWFSVVTDLTSIVVDASPFWIIEVCRWIYSNLWHSLSIALQLVIFFGSVALIVNRSSPRSQTSLIQFCIQAETWAMEHRDSVLTKDVSLSRSLILWKSEQDREVRRAGNASSFIHEPSKLLDGQIRLLRLQRTSILGDLKSELQHFDLDSTPPYEAISYSWGTSKRSHTIEINDLPYPVTPNAEYALRSAQSVFRRKWVWIDSICINQDDSKEKDIQIMIMKEIYRRAVRVIVSLGDAEDTPLVWQLVANLGIATWSKGPAELFAEYQSDISSPAWRGFHRLVQNPWFDRVWVIQEVAVASEIQVHYGSLITSWTDLQAGFFLGGQAFGPAELCLMLAPLREYGRKYSPKKTHAARNMEFIRQREQTGIKMSLYALLELFIFSEASEDRDHVVALQGLSAEGFSKRGAGSGKSAEQIYTEVAIDVLATSDQTRLSILSFAGIGYVRAMKSLPSWAPEWGSGTGAAPLTNTGNCRAITTYDYAAAILVNPIVQVNSQRRLLALGGLLVDTIRSIGKSPPLSMSREDINRVIERESDDEGHRWRREAWQLAQTGTPADSLMGESRREAFWRTLIGNRVVGLLGSCRPAPIEYGQYLQDVEKIRAYKNLVYDTSESGWADLEALICKHLGSIDAYLELSKTANVFHAACGPHSYHRRFCCTEKGSMGLVPPESRVGDLVCILFGAQTPFILRPVETDGDGGEKTDESSYILVGECYMHGMMDGEMITPKAVRQTFTMI